IFDDRAHSFGKDFHALARRSLAAYGGVGQVPNRAIRKAEAGDYVVFADRFLLAGWKRVRSDRNRLRLKQPVHQVYEVTRFAKYRSSYSRVGHPVSAADARGVDSAVHNR